MPSKTSASKTGKSNNSNKEAEEAIKLYLSQKPDFDKLIKEAKESSDGSTTERKQTEYNRKVKEAAREVLEERRKQAEVKK